MTTKFDTAARPLTIAHRAANELHLLRRAEGLGADIIEADVWRHRGNMEVRHLKTMGRIPVLWDRWRLASAWAPRLSLAQLLEAARPETELMLDLKGQDVGLPAHVAEIVEAVSPGRAITVSSQNWSLLKPFRDRPNTCVLHSVGGRRALDRVEGHLRGHDDGAISIHQKLLSPDVVRRLKRVASLIITWPVNDERRLWELHSWGVDGFTIDNLDLLGKVVSARTAST